MFNDIILLNLPYKRMFASSVSVEKKQFVVHQVGVLGSGGLGSGGWGGVGGCFYGKLYLCVMIFFSKKKFFLLRGMCGYSVLYFAVLE